MRKWILGGLLLTLTGLVMGQLVEFNPEQSVTTGRHPSGRVIPNRRGSPTTDPLVNYYVPRSVGVAQVLYDLSEPEMTRHFSTAELLNELASYGIRIAKLWISTDPFDGAWYWGGEDYNMGSHTFDPVYEDMDFVWRDTRFDAFVVRFVNIAWTASSWTRDSGAYGIQWSPEPTYEIAKKMLRRYGDIPITVILTNWEGDNQWIDNDCHLAELRMDYVRRLTEERQEAIERARAEYPDAILRLYHALVINVMSESEDYCGMSLINDVVPYLNRSPDFIGLSYYWPQPESITEAIHYVQDVSGYPAFRIYIDETGASEREYGIQYNRIMRVIPEAFDAGIAFACVWQWRQTFYEFNASGKPLNFGLWRWAGSEGKVEWSGRRNSGLNAVMKLNGTDPPPLLNEPRDIQLKEEYDE